MKATLRLVLACGLLALAGCSALSLLQPSATAQSAATSPPLVVPSPTSSDTEESPAALLIWMPEEFSPESGTPAGDLLQARLEAFAASHPGLEIQVRAKAEQGPGGLLESLTAASEAAPLAMPDLVLLSQADLGMAVERELVAEIGPLLANPGDEDWYGYAHELGTVNGKIYGLPCGGDALILAYRPSTLPEPPETWEASLAVDGVLAFPAGETQALATLAQYLAQGGLLRDEEGEPSLELTPLINVLSYYESGVSAGLTPYWLTQYNSDDLSWQAFRENRAEMAITWTSRYYKSESLTDVSAGTIPTQDGEPYTLATGWVWALSSPQSSRQGLAVELAEFLTESTFLSEWNKASGYLPPRPSSVAAWPRDAAQALASAVSSAAALLPDASLLEEIGAALSTAVISVLKQETDAQTAAQTALESLRGP